MKHTFAAASITLLLLAGCGTTQEATAPTEHLELVSMTPLPSVTSDAYATGMKLNVLMHVLADGTVENVRMLGTSGDAGWDTLALGSMKQWRYAPYRRDGAPTDVWFRQLVVVQIQEPIVMTIGEIARPSQREADSLYALLGRGIDLDPLFRQSIGTFDIVKYPQAVRAEVERLELGDFTAPLRLGDNYIIYKRFAR